MSPSGRIEESRRAPSSAIGLRTILSRSEVKARSEAGNHSEISHWSDDEGEDDDECLISRWIGFWLLPAPFSSSSSLSASLPWLEDELETMSTGCFASPLLRSSKRALLAFFSFSLFLFLVSVSFCFLRSCLLLVFFSISSVFIFFNSLPSLALLADLALLFFLPIPKKLKIKLERALMGFPERGKSWVLATPASGKRCALL